MRTTAFFFSFLVMLASCVQAEEGYVLSVQGVGKEVVLAEIADITVAVEIEKRTAKEAQEAMAERVARVLSSLEEREAEKLETGSLYIYPNYSKSEPRVVVGYRGVQDIRFESQVDGAGELVDQAIAAGANRVQGIHVRPHKDVLAIARSTALRKAAQAALGEARTIMTELGLEERGVYRIQIGTLGNHYPVYRAKALSYDSATSFNTEVTAQEQDIEANVTLEIKYDQA